MKYKTISISSENDVCTVVLNRPDIHNAMNEEMIKELIHCFSHLSTDPTTRIIILTGNGSSFCAGADLHWMKRMVSYSQEENLKDSTLLLTLYETIFSCPKPIIGKINGNAFGGGIGLVAVCDITITRPGSQFAFSEVKLGIIPAVISSYVSSRLSSADMRRLFLTGERFDAEYACKVGLIDYVVPDTDLDSKVQFYVSLLRSSGPEAMHEIKHLLTNLQKMERETYKKSTVKTIAKLRVSQEGQEGITAFLEKKKPYWSK